MSRRAIFLTEGSSSIGLGHITRCLSIAQAFEENAVKCRFLVYGDENVRKINDLPQPELVDWIRFSDFSAVLDAQDIAIIDSYLAPREVYEKIAQTSPQLLCVDDFFRIPYPDRAIVLNGTFNIERFAIPRPKQNSLLGSRFIPLRKPFWDVPARSCASLPKSVLVTFGGKDCRQLTAPIVDALLASFPNLEIHAVIGAAYHAAIPEANSRLILHRNLNACEMCALIMQCDLAVSAAGQTLYELARSGCPTVAVKIADNQTKNFEGALTLGVLAPECAVDATKLDIPAVIHAVVYGIQFLHSQEKRIHFARTAQSNVDGQGARRVADKLKNFALQIQ